jgi:hypothetical protein
VYYLIFAFSTGITAYFSIYRPILRELENLENVCLFELCAPYQTAFILIMLSSFFAPLMFKMALTGPTVEFIENYIEKLLPDDEDD